MIPEDRDPGPLPPQEPEILPPETAVAKKTIPTTLEELAASADGQEIVEARAQILETIRTKSIRATHPSDWLLFKAPDGNITGFLQDLGCKRVAPLWGVDVEPPKGKDEFFYEKTTIEAKDGHNGEFAYMIIGDGYCDLTKRFVRGVMGARCSTDDFIVKQKPPVTGVMLEIRVKQAAMANLAGNILRRLTGLQSVPIEELDRCWQGTGKTSKKCTYGRGFGSGAERRGADVGPAPACPTCKLPGMKYKQGGKTKEGKEYSPFWSCADYPQCKGTMKDTEWKRQQQEQAPPSTDERVPGEEG